LGRRDQLRHGAPAQRADDAVELQTLMPPLVMRMDFSAAPSGDGWNLSRVRMRADTGRVSDVPVPGNAGPLIKKGGSFGTPMGAETLKTPAGSYDCKHYQQASEEQGKTQVWISEKALPVGLVQTIVSALSAKITLVAVGTGASPKIK